MDVLWICSFFVRERPGRVWPGQSSQNRFLVKRKTSLSGSGQGGSGQVSQAEIVFWLKGKRLCQGLAREGLARAVKPKSFFWLKAKRLCQGLAREGLARAVKPKSFCWLIFVRV